MDIKGKRIHITGSADKDTDPSLLQYAHDLITEIVKKLLVESATFAIQVGKDPLDNTDSFPIIFDWTVMATVNECLQQDIVSVSDSQEHLIFTVATSKTENQIPESRRELWEALHEANAVNLEFLEPGWTSGAMRRVKLAERADILIALGGGEGVEHLASLCMQSNKPVIPIDLKIGSSCHDGSGGAFRLAREALVQPLRFLSISDAKTATNLLSRLTTRQGQRPITDVIKALLKLLQTLDEPNSVGKQFQSQPNNTQPIGLGSLPDQLTPLSTIDVLIITALKDELDALLNCNELFSSSRQKCQDSQGYPYYIKSLRHNNGKTLTIAAARGFTMGETVAAMIATRLISELKPRCLAMIGICAGNREAVFLGDVIVAESVFKIDSGKLKVFYETKDNEELKNEEFLSEIRQYKLQDLWKYKIEDFSKNWGKNIQEARPKSYFHQKQWVLYAIYEYQYGNQRQPNPLDHPERTTECPNWKEVIEQLINENLLSEKALELTDIGKDQVEESKWKDPDCRWRDPREPLVHIGPIGTVSMVQQDPKLFSYLKQRERKVLGVEMESAAIGQVAEFHQLPMIIVKSVSDYGDHEKDDSFRYYAAKSSARFLLDFLRSSSVL
jgi:nucleoside phosphorylase